MIEFDQLLSRALDRLSQQQTALRLDDSQMGELLRALRGAQFPALLAVLGAKSFKPPTGGDLGQTLLHEAAGEIASRPELASQGVTADDVERALSAIFLHGARPDSVLRDDRLRTPILNAALRELAERTRVPVTPDQAESALKLLATGEFFGDLASTLAAVAFAVRELPIDLTHDVPHLPIEIARLALALGADLVATPAAIPMVMHDLLSDGKLDHPPGVLTHTMRCLLGFATLGTTSRMVATLLAPENQSVRLAIVIFARTHGIPLEETDLDTLRDSVFASDAPDLGPVLVSALTRYLDARGLPAVLETLRSAAVHG